jgi:parallel beta-helix repeat protein
MTIERISATGNGPSPASGIRVGTNCRISDCTATGNFNGVYADNDAVITRVVANSNSNNGLVAGAGGSIQFSSASKNGNFGIQVGNDVSVSNCSASANAVRGITAADGAVITNCVAAVDGVFAIYTEKSGHVSHCDTRASDVGVRVGDGSMITSCTATACNLDGMQGTSNCTVTNNDSSNNGTFPTNSVNGIHLFGVKNRVDNNHASNNSGFGIVTTESQTNVGSPDVIIRNTSRGNFAGGYSPSSGQFIGPTNQSPSTSTSPWANF